MTSVIEAQKDSVIRVFYAAVGTPMVTGRKVKEFGAALFAETSIDDLEAAGREMTGATRDLNVAEQLQDSVDMLQEVKVVEQIQERVDVGLFQERVEIMREQLETTLHNWREQFTPGVAGPTPVKVEVEVDTPAPKKTATKKTTAKKTAAKKTAPKSTAKKTTAKKTEPKK